MQTDLPLGGWGVDHWQVPGRMPGMSPMQSIPSPHGPTNGWFGLQKSCGPFAQAMQQPSHLVKFPYGQLSGSGPQSTFSHGCLQVGSTGDEQQIGIRQSTERHLQLHGFLPLHCFSARTYMITPTNFSVSKTSRKFLQNCTEHYEVRMRRNQTLRTKILYTCYKNMW